MTSSTPAEPDPGSPALAAATALWQAAGMPAEALQWADLRGAGPVLPSSFDVATAAQASLGLAALAAAEIGHLRGGERQTVSVDRVHAALICLVFSKISCTGKYSWLSRCLYIEFSSCIQKL